MRRALVPGLYETLLNRLLEEEIARIGEGRIQRAVVDPAEAASVLSKHLQRVAEKALEAAGPNAEDRLREQVRLTNRAIEALTERGQEREALGASPVIDPAEFLLAVADERRPGLAAQCFPPRPGIPLSRDDLLVNARDEVSLGGEIRREIPSADRIDLLCSFIKWAGVRLIRDELREWLNTGKKLRVLTTTYVGVTESRALRELASLGAEIKVSYDIRRTRLHAKAWLFHRESGFSTAFIGSSNLSASAMTDGAEWNVRLSEENSPGLVEKFRRAFESYWEEREFEPFDEARFEQEIRLQRDGNAPEEVFFQIELRPFPFQQEILDRLEVERERHGRMENLVVAATGTGKTVMAALDFRREWKRRRDRNEDFRLLFVAHREEILRQSRSMFRLAMRDREFGEILGGGEEPFRGHDVFASIMSLKNRLDPSHPRALRPDEFDMVIVDEVHHAEADSYIRLLDFIRPRILLGLTATPERADGLDIFHRFGSRPAVELRLWDALEKGLLSPFHYFGIYDETDLRDVGWVRGRYETSGLQNLYTGNDSRVRIILSEIMDKVGDVARMKALGFCVSVAHARYMAEKFSARGVAAVAIHGDTPSQERQAALRRLREGQIKVVFAVDIFNEGVDLPEVNTLLFLRPTESATVFLQQLGRGLRFHDDKSLLTVLDFIGHANRRFRFDRKFRGILQGRGGALKRQVEQGFPVLPAGCAMKLDRQAEEVVLGNIQEALAGGTGPVVEALREAGDVGLGRFLAGMDWEPSDLYRKASEVWTWNAMRRAAGLPAPASGPYEVTYARALAKVLHVDDAVRLSAWRAWLREDEPPRAGVIGPSERRLLAMLHFLLWGTRAGRGVGNLDDVIGSLWEHPAIRGELVDILDVLDERAEHLERFLDEIPGVPLVIHGRYMRDEILAAFDELSPERPVPWQAGVKWIEPFRIDLFFVTIQKAVKDYSPDTMYRDGALSQRLFQWDSQNSTAPESPTGRRYVNHEAEGSKVLLFVRPARKDDRGVTAPYTFLGTARYLAHRGSRPMAITWELEHPIPGWFYPSVRHVA